MKGDNEAELGSGMAPDMSKEQQDLVLLSLNSCADVGKVLGMCRLARMASLAVANVDVPVRADLRVLSSLLSELQNEIEKHGERMFEMSKKMEELRCHEPGDAPAIGEAADRLH